jgi:hypothetical protein
MYIGVNIKFSRENDDVFVLGSESLIISWIRSQYDELKGRNELISREDICNNCQSRHIGNIPRERRIFSDSCGWMEFEKG